MNFIEHLNKYYPDDLVEKLIKELKKERTSSLILNTQKIDNIFFKNEFPEIENHPFLKNVYYFDKKIYELGKNYLFDNGAYYIMDASSMLVSYFLNPKNNDLILDMCAAPGGKTIFASLNNKNIRIIANDLSHSRALTLSSNIEKLGLKNVIVINFNFLNDQRILNKTFDKIILDAPCSGSAMFRKLEEMRDDWTYEKVLNCQKIQFDLLNRAIDLLKDGGELIYSTCSFSYEENEENILNLLKTRNDIELTNLPSIKGDYRHPSLKEAIHVFPTFYKGEGQFIAKIKKKGELINNSKNILSNEKEIKNYKDIISLYNLDFASYKKINNELYGSSFEFDNKKIPLVRYGVNIGEFKKNYFLPSFNLAHYLSNKNSIILNEKEAKKYIKGETIIKNLPLKDGYYIVSFKNINLGYIKYVKGVLKNLYPKGLRH